MAAIEKLKKDYAGSWLAIEVTRYEGFEPVEGELICHSEDRRGLWEKVKLEKGRRVYIAYAGPLIEEGYAVAFYAV